MKNACIQTDEFEYENFEYMALFIAQHINNVECSYNNYERNPFAEHISDKHENFSFEYHNHI